MPDANGPEVWGAGAVRSGLGEHFAGAFIAELRMGKE